jgi:hypothetical protein
MQFVEILIGLKNEFGEVHERLVHAIRVTVELSRKNLVFDLV